MFIHYFIDSNGKGNYTLFNGESQDVIFNHPSEKLWMIDEPEVDNCQYNEFYTRFGFYVED